MSLGFWLIRGSALGPIGGLSTRQFNSCLPRREEKKREESSSWCCGMSERYESAAEVRHLIVTISNSSLFSTRYEVETDTKKHKEFIYISLTSDIMTKVCINGSLKILQQCQLKGPFKHCSVVIYIS